MPNRFLTSLEHDRLIYIKNTKTLLVTTEAEDKTIFEYHSSIKTITNII